MGKDYNVHFHLNFKKENMDRKNALGLALGVSLGVAGDVARLSDPGSLPHKIAEFGDCYDAVFGMYNPFVNTCGREETPLHKFADEVKTGIRQALEE